MKKLPDLLEFDWDEGNIDKNLILHNVADNEAEALFRNKLRLSPDKSHSEFEERWLALGITDKRRFLFVSFTIRQEKIRVISARDMTPKERKVYKKYEKT